MAAIFVSYRRLDSGSAGRLADPLENKYDTFFDRNDITPGDDFPDTIRSAAEEARLFLIVIGRHWLHKRQLKRLSNKADWVRQELLLALRRHAENDLRIVPILVDGVSMPKADQLPEELHSLTRIQYEELRHGKWQDDLQSLMRLMDQWLQGPAHAISTRRPDTQIVPLLCDRRSQEQSLFDFFEEQGEALKTPVILCHGHKLERHDGFLDRLDLSHAFEDLFDISSADVRVLVKPLHFSPDSAAAGNCPKALKTAAGICLLKSRKVTLADIQTHFATISQPHVFTWTLTAEEVHHYGHGLIEEIIGAWRALFKHEGTASANRHSDLPYAVVLWINVTYDDDTSPLDFDAILSASSRAVLGVLPELAPIEEGHILRWLELDEVKDHFRAKRSSILSLVEDDACCFEKGKLHMNNFVERVSELLGQRP